MDPQTLIAKVIGQHNQTFGKSGLYVYAQRHIRFLSVHGREISSGKRTGKTAILLSTTANLRGLSQGFSESRNHS